MLGKLTTTIRKVQTNANPKNIQIVNDFLDYMRKNGSSGHHQNYNLKVVIAFANFLGKESSFYGIKRMILEVQESFEEGGRKIANCRKCYRSFYRP